MKAAPLFGILLVLLAAYPGPSTAQEKRRTALRLEPGQTVAGQLRFDRGSASYEINVPESAFAAALVLSRASADLDLFVKRRSEVVYSRETGGYGERLLLSRLSEPALKPGKYTVEVKYPFSFPPVKAGKSVKTVSYELSYTVFTPLPERLLPGQAKSGVLAGSNAKFLSYFIDVPEGTRHLRFDLFDASGDLDLWAARSAVPLDTADAEWRGSTTVSRESLCLGDGQKDLESGRYCIAVLEPAQGESSDGFSLLASFTAVPPAGLLEIPAIPRPADPLENALRATVEVHREGSAGSGCIVSRSGYVLTNLHVLGDYGGKEGEKPVIAFNLKNDLPPTELFRATVVRTDAVLDLALLKIDAGFYGQPLPPGLELPCFMIGDSERLTIGEPLGFVGYPAVGGTRSRASVSFMQGVVCGFERIDSGKYVKTDAGISEGNSGGAAMNYRRELVGLPTQVVGASGGQMGFITPISMVPKEWLKLIGAK